jgi:hypothetical protein
MVVNEGERTDCDEGIGDGNSSIRCFFFTGCWISEESSSLYEFEIDTSPLGVVDVFIVNFNGDEVDCTLDNEDVEWLPFFVDELVSSEGDVVCNWTG